MVELIVVTVDEGVEVMENKVVFVVVLLQLTLSFYGGQIVIRIFIRLSW
jgi:hypothetical protein